MTKKKKILIIIVMIILVIVSSIGVFLKYQNRKSQTILNLTTEQKAEEFQVLCRILKECYPFWEEVSLAGVDREAISKDYEIRIKETKTDIEYFKEIQYFLKEFQRLGHLSVLDGYMYRAYMEAFGASNDMLTEREKGGIAPLLEILTSPNSQKIYNLLDQSHEGFRSIVGLKEEYQRAENHNTAAVQSQIKTEILENGKAAYIKIPSFAWNSYKNDKCVLEKFFTEIEDIPHLIIDIRGNGGGSDLYWKDLLVAPNAKEELISERYYLFQLNDITSDFVSAQEIEVKNLTSAKESFLKEYADIFSNYTIDTTNFTAAGNAYPGKIWVLVDNKVYSASENFVMFCKNTGFATLVGAATGGDGGMADPLLLSLPNSGLIVRFSMFYGLNADGSGNEWNGTLPDVVVAENEDALEKCLGMLE